MRRRTARERRVDREARQRYRVILRERGRAARVADLLHALVRDGLRTRDKVYSSRGLFRRHDEPWGERAIDAFSRAERAIAEARRYGSR